MAGRPAHQPTDQQRRQVEAMAGYGIPHLDIAAVLGIDRKTLEKHYENELDTGSAKAMAKVGQFLYHTASGAAIKDGASYSDCVRSAIFWMKVRAGWSEKTQHEITGKDGGPIRTITTEMTAQEAAEAYADTLNDR